MTIFEDYLVVFKIGIAKVVGYIFPKKLSYDLRKSNHFYKIFKKRWQGKILSQQTLLKVLFFLSFKLNIKLN